ncbi:MAG: hypothetical protein H7Y12_13365 [Sphingobacteriaceae bacterium]|nr:hypothetical protein [Cytophagaceae bacterium]
MAYNVTGEVNFWQLMLIGNLSLLGILTVFYRLITQNSIPGRIFLSLPFLLLTLQHHENMLWGMAALQNFTVVLFMLLGLYWLSKGAERTIGLELIAGVFCSITSGNGNLIWPLGVGILLLQKRWCGLGIWGVMGATAIALYFHNYQQPPGNPAAAVEGAGVYVKGFLEFIGAFADWFPESPRRFAVPVVAGTILTSVAATLGFRTIVRSPWGRGTATQADYFLLGVCGFVVISALTVTVNRIGFGEWVLLTSRVKIYSVLLLMTVLVVGLKEVKRNYQFFAVRIALVLAVVFNGYTALVEYGEMLYRRQERLTWLFNWRYGQQDLPAYNRTRFPYRAPETVFDGMPETRHASRSDESPTFAIDSIYRRGGSVVVENKLFEKPSGSDAGAYLLLQTGNRRYLFPVRQQRNTSRRRFLQNLSYFGPGFSAEINSNEIPSGAYELRVLTTDGDHLTEATTNQKMTFAGTGSTPLPTNW